MREDLKQMLIEGAAQFGISLTDKQINQFQQYMDILKEWNEKINLTAIESDQDIIVKHYLDSLSILPHIQNKNISLIDVGTGAGFPGIPLKIAFDSINIMLLDSLEKRIKFLNEVINLLGLEGVKTKHARAEDAGRESVYREMFDVSTARAVAGLPVLLEYCLPFVKLGGLFIAMKGSNIDEVESSKKALDVLGGEIEDIREIVLPFSDIKRNIIIIRKLRHTPTKYPRKAGKPSKDPLI